MAWNLLLPALAMGLLLSMLVNAWRARKIDRQWQQALREQEQEPSRHLIPESSRPSNDSIAGTTARR